MQKICAKMVPRNLTKEQKESRMNGCLDLLERIENDEKFLFKHVITGDESWIFPVRSRNQTTKFGVAHQQLTASEESKNEQIENRIRINLFFFPPDSQRVVHKQFVPQGQTDNEQYYRDVLERLGKMLSSAQRLRTLGCWITTILPCHTANSMNEFLTKKCIPVVPQHPYSPALNPFDLFLIPRPKFQPQRSSFWNCGQSPKDRDRPAEGSST